MRTKYQNYQKMNLFDVMYRFPVYWTEKLKIDFLQRVILINSYLYYEEDCALMTDKQFDEISNDLFKRQKAKGIKWVRDRTQYGYVFYDYDSNTGFDLYDRLNEKDKYFIKTISDWLRRKKE